MPKEKKCEDCASCEQVYIKGGYGFNPADCYLCSVTEGFTDKNGVCEHWQEKVHEYDLSAERFQRAEEDILAIMQIFKEKRITFLSLRPRKRRIST